MSLGKTEMKQTVISIYLKVGDWEMFRICFNSMIFNVYADACMCGKNGVHLQDIVSLTSPVGSATRFSVWVHFPIYRTSNAYDDSLGSPLGGVDGTT